jgi:hypothetical protein
MESGLRLLTKSIFGKETTYRAKKRGTEAKSEYSTTWIESGKA